MFSVAPAVRPKDGRAARQPPAESLSWAVWLSAEKPETGPKALPITLAQILAWADAWHAQTGQWPTRESGAVPGAGLTWGAVNEALKAGWRGLPGGDTLAKFLACQRGASGHWSLGDPAKKAEALRLRAEGWTLQAIGDRFGICKQAVSVTLRKATREQLPNL
jgi:hypothetical protein